MKNLSWFNRIMFFLNIVLTVLTAIAYILPFMAPKLFPLLSVFTLVLPLMLVLNFVCFLYWLIQAKKQMLLSGLILLLGITFISKFYRFTGTNAPEDKDDFTLMSYNVRLFNLYGWLPAQDIPFVIPAFIKEKDPDILCLQEYNKIGNASIKGYKYKYIFSMEGQTGQAIYSRFPIIGKGDIQFPGSANNAVYADIKKGKDTLRVYSMHLQSIKISPDIHESIDEEKSKVIFNRISAAFTKQQLQAELVEKHKNECPYPMIICGDLNNSAFSYVYRSVKGNMNDAFEEAGKGFGKSYNFKYYPARIDYVFTDKTLEVKEYATFSSFVNSDHFPIMTRLCFEPKEEE
ncbi:endonuclease [Flavobacterium sp. Sd200]|uniref:endonuclease/exonuclease/phosphatase family protein n=1 Tax=Flavobacterium sp. Sd200 TaxID=2692211 RepID=UPI00136D8879|nr:endonuclease/exonuclease/phosphatase family protein [Flavobacterium sp. Sd200]MXN92987.1 endonuclease [Flavobacterium sp. Sd200]